MPKNSEKDESTKMKSLLVYVTDDQHAHLKRVAMARGQTLAATVRDMIDAAPDYEFIVKK